MARAKPVLFTIYRGGVLRRQLLLPTQERAVSLGRTVLANFQLVGRGQITVKAHRVSDGSLVFSRHARR